MHRTLFRPRTLARTVARNLLGATLLALLSLGAPGRCPAQPAGTSGSSLIVPINGTVKLQVSSKKPIAKVESAKDGVVGIRTQFGSVLGLQRYCKNPSRKLWVGTSRVTCVVSG